MTTQSSLASTILGFILLIAIAGGIIYALSSHIILINTCSADSTLIFQNKTGLCLSHNSSIAISEGTIVPLAFKFIGNNPLLYIWNQKISEKADSYVFMSIPDTFRVHMQYNATSDTEFLVMTNQQYVAWVNSNGANAASVFSLSGKQVSGWFNDSAGCAGYVAVIISTSHSAFSIYPNETALYDPAPSPTGVCA
ncbi:MAG: hypothetical protein M1433_00475 [Candidatus Parvarchaeota archaeon]|nr:hypothetical protein [Candidatus Parvarchaeota archaeon]